MPINSYNRFSNKKAGFLRLVRYNMKDYAEMNGKEIKQCISG